MMIPKTKILIVDDEKSICDFLNKALTEEGYKVYTSTEENGAIDLVKTKGIDMLLLDLNLPGRGGLEILRQIKKIDRDTVVVMIADHGNIATAKTAMMLGAHDYITRPIELDFIKDAVKDGLSQTVSAFS